MGGSVSQEQKPVGEGSKRPQMERNRVEKNDVSGVETGANTSHGQMGGSWKSRREFMRFINSYNSEIRSCDRHYVKIALEAYEKRTGVKHEIKRILFTHRKSVLVPGYEGVREWCHVSFTAKPKNTDHRPKHFFGEMVLDPISGTRDVTHCSTFEPSGAGLTYGCGFCPESPSVLHPAYAYRAGLPSSTYPTKLSYDYVVAL
ncbi:uncharacterized protein [Euphorbia lathyris]|uniref:uncharacterized protein isoform X2 n=1 Tax=Euphorbia lathyris TaxID=212925 RepID=UPI003313AF15